MLVLPVASLVRLALSSTAFRMAEYFAQVSKEIAPRIQQRAVNPM